MACRRPLACNPSRAIAPTVEHLFDASGVELAAHSALSRRRPRLRGMPAALRVYARSLEQGDQTWRAGYEGNAFSRSPAAVRLVSRPGLPRRRAFLYRVSSEVRLYVSNLDESRQARRVEAAFACEIPSGSPLFQIRAPLEKTKTRSRWHPRVQVRGMRHRGMVRSPARPPNRPYQRDSRRLACRKSSNAMPELPQPNADFRG